MLKKKKKKEDFFMKKLIVIIPVILLISLSVYIGITYFNIGKYDEYYINNTILKK